MSSRLIRIRRRFLILLLCVSTVGALGLGYASQARAAAPYNNSDLATKALTYVGQAGTVACRDAGKTGGDQCKQFVNCIVWMVSGRRQWPAPGYHSGFQAVGGVEVTRSAATTGDVIQVGNADSDNPLHTAIVVRNLGNNNFEVVDANWGFTGMVAKHSWSPPSGARIWRLGTVPSGGNARLVGDFNGDGLSDAAVMFRDQGIAKVALSTGGSFGYPGDWSYGHSVGAHSYFAGDVNGDGRDDLVAYFASSHTWKVSLSSGS
ncbi:MAG TPA: VCBS repeat-containing protein, partial [Candidatus Saccharimonadales bacterium]|nr:VCBS repeat-containing protein [Candidatus Saccharimonadales bacterium]